MMNRGGFGDEMFGELLETGQQAVKQTTTTPKAILTGAVQQVIPAIGTNNAQVPARSDNAGTNEQAVQSSATSQQFVKEEVRRMYGLDDVNEPAQNLMQQTTAPEQTQTPDEQARMAEVRQKLAEHKKQHRDSYFEPTFNRPAPQKQSVQDEHEREEQEKKMEDLQKEEKKPKQLPLNMRPKGSGELKGGVVG